MDQLFDRLTDLLRSMGQTASSSSASSADNDETAAWEELNDYLGEGSTSSSRRDSARNSGSPRQGSTHYGRAGGPPQSLKKDFANLELPFGATMEQARAAHRKLIRAYHPDRHATNPDKYRIANEITQRVNYSFQRIKQYYEHGVTPEGRDSP